MSEQHDVSPAKKVPTSEAMNLLQASPLPLQAPSAVERVDQGIVLKPYEQSQSQAEASCIS
jgi:hypothetical protein